jgi:radical SAM superfamily enzyme YgiQ (UPF0313 family)
MTTPIKPASPALRVLQTGGNQTPVKKHTLDILFVNQPSPDSDFIIRDVNRSGRKTRERMIWPQTNLAWEAAVMRKAGFTVGLIDCIASKLSWEDLERRIREIRPRYVVANVISTALTNDMRLFFIAKSFDAITIAQGPHVTDKAIESLNRFPALDFACVHEVEETLKELIVGIEAGRKTHEGVLGLAWRNGTNVIENERRPFISDLNTLPMPAYDLLPLDQYRMPFFGNYVFIEAGRGCPYRCIYCRQTVMWQSKVRNRSAEAMFEEVVELRRLGVRSLMFQHDTFTADRKNVMKLCDLLIEARMDVRWCCNTHVNNVDPELVARMKKAGCWMIAPGFESASQEILNNVKKRSTVEQNVKAAHMIHDAGIEVWGYFMFGNPGETKATIDATIAMAKSLPLEIANFSVASPYPGTEFFSQAVENNWLVADANWEDFDQNYSPVVDYGHLRPNEIYDALKRANREFFLRPKQLKRILKEFRDLDSALYLAGIAGGYAKLFLGREGVQKRIGDRHAPDHHHSEPLAKKAG